jgi:hypothetical protein
MILLRGGKDCLPTHELNPNRGWRAIPLSTACGGARHLLEPEGGDGEDDSRHQRSDTVTRRCLPTANERDPTGEAEPVKQAHREIQSGTRQEALGIHPAVAAAREDIGGHHHDPAADTRRHAPKAGDECLGEHATLAQPKEGGSSDEGEHATGPENPRRHAEDHQHEQASIHRSGPG